MLSHAVLVLQTHGPGSGPRTRITEAGGVSAHHPSTGEERQADAWGLLWPTLLGEF